MRSANLARFSLATIIGATLGFILLIGALPAFAQRTTGTITGVVTDPSGAVVPGVSVVATDDATGVKTTAVCTTDGVYTVLYLTPGTYTVNFEKAGFKKFIRKGIVVQLSQVARVNARLELGSTTQAVTVTGQAALIATDTSERGTVLTGKLITQLPVEGRAVYNLTTLMPGWVSQNTNFGGGTAGGGRESFNGTRAFSINVQLDGIPANLDQSNDYGQTQPILGSVSEFSILTNNFSAEFGRGGAVLIAVRKTGTNKFHGSLYDFLQNNALNARNFFAVGNPPVRFNQFGGTIGGPIKHDRTFFFFGYEGTRTVNPGSSILTIPTNAMRQGDFSAAGLSQIYDPCGYVDLGQPCTLARVAQANGVRRPFPGNVIDRPLDPVALNIQKYWPAPSRDTLANNFDGKGGSRSGENKFDVTFDHLITPSERLFFGLDYNKTIIHFTDPLGPNALACAGFCGVLPIQVQQWSAGLTSNLGPSFLNNLRFGFLRNNTPWTAASEDMNLPAKLGLNNVPPYFFPSIGISGGGMNVSLGPGTHFKLRDNQFTVLDNVVYIKGKQTLKVGVNLRRVQVNSGPSWSSGGFGFTGIFSRDPAVTNSGAGYADFLLGLPASYGLSASPDVIGARRWSIQQFVEDTYKATHNLTLNLGLRYEIESPFTEVHNRYGWMDPNVTNPITGNPGAFVYASSGNKAPLGTRWDHLAPRVGFAWAPGSGHISIRGGYGIYFSPPTAQVDFTSGTPGYAISEYVATTDQFTPLIDLSVGPPPYSLPNPADRTPSIANNTSVFYLPSNNPYAYQQEWYFGVQRQLGRHIAVKAAYVGTKGTHLLFYRNINQVPENLLGPGDARPQTPFPQYFGVNAILNDGTSIYHSFQLSVEKQLSHGLQFNSTYTWSKSIDSNSVDFTTGTGNDYQSVTNLRANRALSDFDVPQRFTTDLVYQLPFGLGRTYLNQGGLLNAVLGGWQFSGIIIANSGYPFTVYSTPNLTNSLSGELYADRLGNGTLPNPTIHKWFDTAAFAPPAPYTYGNSGRDILRGPGFWDNDLMLAKAFSFRTPLNEETQLQFRSEFYNAFNKPNFRRPQSTVGTSGIGTITSAMSPRSIQFALRLTF